MSLSRHVVLATMALLVGLLSPMGAAAQVEDGIAAGYPHDQGIGGHPSVVFTEGFEQASVADLVSGWDQVQHQENMSLVSDVPATSGGNQSLYISGGWGDLYRQLLPGHEQLYARFYAKLDPSCVNVHHWVWLGGHNPPTAWPWPRAGTRPAGDERWSTGLEPFYSGSSPPWRWAFYTYWMHMRIDPDGNYWGNMFHNTPPVPADRGEWLCLEFMVKMNDPADAFNGEQAFWVNGVRRSHIGPGFPNARWDQSIFVEDPGGEPFEGFQFRSTTDLNINYFWLEHFVDYDDGCEAWFDDVVIATEYIGPMVSEIGPVADAGLPDVRVADARVPDSAVADTSAADTSAADTSAADASAADSFMAGDSATVSVSAAAGCACVAVSPVNHAGLIAGAVLMSSLASCRRRRSGV